MSSTTNDLISWATTTDLESNATLSERTTIPPGLLPRQGDRKRILRQAISATKSQLSEARVVLSSKLTGDPQGIATVGFTSPIRATSEGFADTLESTSQMKTHLLALANELDDVRLQIHNLNVRIDWEKAWKLGRDHSA
ncbi:hypothetical protein HII31_04001 [Pseudocercospora fuligena]|uniref:Uncharacterized protein n=1 Tax=Pseudocercospora fuligena TaxID=685502 RepID=A0A8H6RNN6_9PEZI|nr:hypothetical protein HII31_04001 [Pseudocercospora fuligena]